MKWTGNVVKSVTALTILFLFGCAKQNAEGPTREITPFGAGKKNRLAILTATPRLGAGKLMALDLRDGKLSESRYLVDGDPAMKVLPLSQKIIVFNRKSGGSTSVYRDNLSLVANYKLLPEVAFPNFQDAIEIKKDEAYVSSHEIKDLLRIKVDTGEVLKRLPLGAFADADGIPEATRLARLGDRVALLLQRVARPDFTPKENSQVAVIDENTDLIEEKAIHLNGKNASTIAPFGDQKAFVGCQGSYSDSKSGAIEILDLARRSSQPTEWSNEKMGGKPMALFSLSRFFLGAIFYTAEGKTRLGFSQGKGFHPWGADQSFDNGYWSLLIDAERRVAWVGQAGGKKNLLLAISLDSYETVRTIELEDIPMQLEWID